MLLRGLSRRVCRHLGIIIQLSNPTLGTRPVGINRLPVWQTPVWRTRMRTSWAFGAATSTSSIERGWPASHATAAYVRTFSIWYAYVVTRECRLFGQTGFGFNTLQTIDCSWLVRIQTKIARISCLRRYGILNLAHTFPAVLDIMTLRTSPDK